MLGLLFNKQKLFTDSKRLGRWGEKRCEKFLRRKGLKTLTRNFSCKTGEIDLIMVAPDGTLVFVEVKTRKNEDFSAAEDAITFAKKSRMIKAARYFLQTHNIEDRPCRFDVVTIIVNETAKEEIRHYENAFTP